MLLDERTSIAQWIFINVPSGLAIGTLMVSQPIAAQARASKANTTVAASLSPFFRAIGQALGIVVGGAIFQNRFQSLLSNSPDVAVRLQADSLAKEYTQLESVVQATTRQTGEVQRAFTESTHAIWWCLLAVATFAGLVSSCIREIPLGSRRKQQASDDEKA